MEATDPTRGSSRAAVLAAVGRSPVLRRLMAGFLAFSISEWATWLAIVVYAYTRGGATEAATLAFLQLAPSIVIAPLASSLGDRYPRASVLVGTYLFQGVAMGTVALALAVDSPSWVVYAAAIVAATAVTLTRPVQAALLPEVVATLDELTAANVTSGAAESLGRLIGPIVAGVLVGLGGAELTFAVSATAMLASGSLLLPMARAAGRRPDVDRAEWPGIGSVGRELAAGFAAIVHDPSLLAVVAVSTVALALYGALDIFYAVLAFDVLGLGDSGVGFLGAATGVGSLVGSAASVALIGRARLAPAIVIGSVLFGGAVAAISLAPDVLAVVALLAAGGAGGVVIAVGSQSLVQRIAPTAVLSRVFGVLEGSTMAAQALGALAVPILVVLAGPTGALAIAGLALPAMAVIVARGLSAADRRAMVPTGALTRLRAVPMFEALAGPVIERLANAALPISVAPGTAVVTEGEAGDRYYVIESGQAEVRIGGRLIRVLGPGQGFGEIALLRDVPRTATVTAVGTLDLLALDREPFLEAMTGQPA
jgi:hypothetical protein